MKKPSKWELRAKESYLLKYSILRRKLRAHVRSLGTKLSIAEKNDLSERRRHLNSRIDRFQWEAATIMIPLFSYEDQVLKLVQTRNDGEIVDEDEDEDNASDMIEEEEEGYEDGCKDIKYT